MRGLSGEGQDREEGLLIDASENDQRDDGSGYLQREQRFQLQLRPELVQPLVVPGLTDGARRLVPVGSGVRSGVSATHLQAA